MFLKKMIVTHGMRTMITGMIAMILGMMVQVGSLTIMMRLRMSLKLVGVESGNL